MVNHSLYKYLYYQFYIFDIIILYIFFKFYRFNDHIFYFCIESLILWAEILTPKGYDISFLTEKKEEKVGDERIRSDDCRRKQRRSI
jgi:hypothetical protein